MSQESSGHPTAELLPDRFLNWLRAFGDEYPDAADLATPRNQSMVEGLWHENAPLPAGACEQLELEFGSTFAEAIHHLIREYAYQCATPVHLMDLNSNTKAA